MKAFTEIEERIKELAEPYETTGSNNLAKYLAHLLDIAKVCKEWLKHYADTGPDNGPSLCEQDCAEKMKAIFDNLERTCAEIAKENKEMLL